MKKIKVKFRFVEEKGKNIEITPMEDTFIIDRPICFKSGTLTLEIDPKNFKIEPFWDEDHT